jgi:hypothetical protein
MYRFENDNWDTGTEGSQADCHWGFRFYDPIEGSAGAPYERAHSHKWRIDMELVLDRKPFSLQRREPFHYFRKKSPHLSFSSPGMTGSVKYRF